MLRRSGAAVSWYGYFPVANLPQAYDAELTRAREGRAGQAQVKERILAWMEANGIGEWQGGQLKVVHQESDQRFIYQPERAWRMSYLSTTVRDGDIEEVATLNAPFFSETPWRYSGLLRVGDIIEDSWESQHCALQLASHLGIERRTLEDLLDTLRPSWRLSGLLAADLLAIGKKLCRTVYILGDNRLLEKHESPSKQKAIACHLALGHLHLYKSAHAFKGLTASRAAKPAPHKAVLTDHSARAQSM